MMFQGESGRLPTASMTRRLLFTGGVASALAGCAGLPIVKPAPQLYTLTSKSTYPEDLPSVGWQLAVERPTAPAGLSSARIAVARQPLTLDYYAGVLWVDDAPNMVQRLLIESFENSDRIVGVGRNSVSFRSDYTLKVELREFQAEYFSPDARPLVHVRINVKLVQMPQRVIVASGDFPAKRDAPSNQMADIAATFDDTLGDVLREIVVWTLGQG